MSAEQIKTHEDRLRFLAEAHVSEARHAASKLKDVVVGLIGPEDCLDEQGRYLATEELESMLSKIVNAVSVLQGMANDLEPIDAQIDREDVA